MAVRAGPLSALSTRASCEPATGLLQWHTATCYLNTYDGFGNPQLGALPGDFVATYLANPGPLGESAVNCCCTFRDLGNVYVTGSHFAHGGQWSEGR